MSVVVLVVAAPLLLMFIFVRPALLSLSPGQWPPITIASPHCPVIYELFSACPQEWECNVLPAFHFVQLDGAGRDREPGKVL